jgi:hypothetical protein
MSTLVPRLYFDETDYKQTVLALLKIKAQANLADSEDRQPWQRSHDTATVYHKVQEVLALLGAGAVDEIHSSQGDLYGEYAQGLLTQAERSRCAQVRRNPDR